MCTFYKKGLIFLFIFILFSIVVTSLDECQGTMTNDLVPCLILLPTNQSCSSINISFYNETTNLHNYTMLVYNSFLCSSEFNYTQYGTYTFYYTTGDSGSIILKEDSDNKYYLYLVAIIISIVFLGIGLKIENVYLIMLSGILDCIIGLYLIIYGYPALTNIFLKNSMGVIIIGLGMYLIVAPIVDELGEMF